jgi:hypothetical protein
MRSSIFTAGATLPGPAQSRRARRLCDRHAQLHFRLALQHRPRVYIRLGFVPIGEVDEVSARLNLIAGTQT